jgi:hypothetical protein
LLQNKVIEDPRGFPLSIQRLFFYLASIVLLAGLFILQKDAGPRIYSDTYAYADMAKQSYASLVVSMRPFFSVAMFKLVSADHGMYIKMQLVIYAAAWLWLLFATGRSATKAVFAIPLCATIVYFGLNPVFSLWTNALLTESICVSAMAVASGFFIAYRRSGRTAHLTGAAIALVFVSNYKDLTAYYALLWVVPFFLVTIANNFKIKPALLFTVAITCASLFSLWAADHVGRETHETRWYFSMLNNIGKRVMVNDEFNAFYKANGMPSSPALEAFRGNYGSDGGLKVYKQEELKDFREWLRRDGKAVYAKLLFNFPHYSLAPLFSADGDIFQENLQWLQWYVPPGIDANAIAPPDFSIIFFCNIAICIFIAVYACLNRTRELALTTLAAFSILLISPLIGLLAYHADAMEVARHELPALAHMALSTVILLAISLSLPSMGTKRLGQTVGCASVAIAGMFYLLDTKAYHADWASTKFYAPGTSYIWNGCMLATAVGRPNDQCEMVKAAPYRSGHLTYGPYVRLPAGQYHVEIGYASTEKDIAGDWDVAISYPDGTHVVAKGLLHGTDSAKGIVKGNFTVDDSEPMGSAEVHTFSHHHLDLKVNYVRISRLR